MSKSKTGSHRTAHKRKDGILEIAGLVTQKDHHTMKRLEKKLEGLTVREFAEKTSQPGIPGWIERTA